MFFARLGVLARQLEFLHGLDRHPGQVDRVDLEVGEHVVRRTEELKRVGRVADLGQVARR